MVRPAVSAEVRHNLELLGARRRDRAVRNLWRNRLMYLMLLPGLAVILIYRYVPMYGLTIAFKDFRVSRGILRSPWVGLENFEKFFGSPFFELIISNTIVISLLKLLFVFPVPIVIALMLNEVLATWYKRSVQTVLYLPHFLSWVVIGHLATIFLAPVSGVITNLLNVVGISINMLMDPASFRATLVITEIWKEAGWGTIIFWLRWPVWIPACMRRRPSTAPASCSRSASSPSRQFYR